MQSLQSNSMAYLRTHTSVMDHVGDVERSFNVLVWHLEQWLVEHLELARIMVAILTFATVLFVSSVVQGFIRVDFSGLRYMKGWPEAVS